MIMRCPHLRTTALVCSPACACNGKSLVHIITAEEIAAEMDQLQLHDPALLVRSVARRLEKRFWRAEHGAKP